MTRQEFTAAIVAVRTGKAGATLNLWEETRRFVSKFAYQWANNSGGRIQREDLMQAGFLAMLDAVERFDLKREDCSFLSVLRLTLKTRFAEVSGVRTTKRDAFFYAESTDAPAYGDEDSPLLSEIVPDENATLAFTGVEYKSFLHYCRRIIGAALDSLPPMQSVIVRHHYLNDMTLDEVAAMCGLSSKQAVKEIEERALDRLARGKYRKELRECLWMLEDFHAARDAARLDQWATSRTETAALKNIEKKVR